MRKRILFCVFLMAIVAVLPARAQIRFGVKGGLQLASMEFNSEVLDETNRAGFFVGPTLKIGLPVTGLGIDVSALYDQRDLKVQGETFKQQSLLLQGDFRCGAGLGDILCVFIKFGPQLSFNVGDDVMLWITDKGDKNQFALQETMLSINLGAGLTFAKHFEGAIHYNIPISKTGDFTWTQLGDVLLDQTLRHAKTRTNSWSASVTFFF